MINRNCEEPTLVTILKNDPKTLKHQILLTVEWKTILFYHPSNKWFGIPRHCDCTPKPHPRLMGTATWRAPTHSWEAMVAIASSLQTSVDDGWHSWWLMMVNECQKWRNQALPSDYGKTNHVTLSVTYSTIDIGETEGTHGHRQNHAIFHRQQKILGSSLSSGDMKCYWLVMRKTNSLSHYKTETPNR